MNVIIFSFFWLTSVFYASGCGYWDETQMVWSWIYEEWMEKVETFLQCLVSSRLGHFSNLVCFVSVDLLSSWKEKRRRKKERKERQRYLWIDLRKWVWIRINFDENVNPKDSPTAKERVLVYTTCNINAQPRFQGLSSYRHERPWERGWQWGWRWILY